PPEVAEAALLRRLDPNDPRTPHDRSPRARVADVLRYFPHVWTPRLAVECALPGLRDPAVLRACADVFEPEAWDAVADEVHARPMAGESARWLLAGVSTPEDPRWAGLWRLGIAPAPEVPGFFARLGAHPERVALVEAAEAFDHEVGRAVASPAVAQRLLDAYLATPLDALGAVLARQGVHAVAPVRAALETRPDRRERLLRVLVATGADAALDVLRPALFDRTKAVREIAVRALARVPFDVVEADLREALASKTKTPRRHALDYLEARRGPEVTAFAASVQPADAEVAERLAALSGAPRTPDDPFDAAVAAIARPKDHADVLDTLPSSLAADPDGTLAKLVALAPHTRLWPERGETVVITSRAYREAWAQVPLESGLARRALALAVLKCPQGLGRYLLSLAPVDAAFAEVLLAACERHPPYAWRDVLAFLRPLPAFERACGLAVS
ncbi:MAG: hypothetical protein KC656_31845, partial [Myxococcales bacterium]|nr:hypothetical protein [Myxococcales bacterium]